MVEAVNKIKDKLTVRAESEPGAEKGHSKLCYPQISKHPGHSENMG